MAQMAAWRGLASATKCMSWSSLQVWQNTCGILNLSSITKRLCSSQTQNVCNGANIYKDGQDPPIKEDSEYPDWLWTLSSEKLSLDQLSTDDVRYWRKLRKTTIKQQNALRKQGKIK